MTTLAEIESAADSLTEEEKERLLRYLAVRLRKARLEAAPRIYSSEEISGSRR